MRRYRGLTKEGKLVYGWYIYLKPEDRHYIIPEDEPMEKHLPDYASYGIFSYIKIIPKTVGQFTGSKDSYHQEKYQDDIIKITLRSGHTRIGVIEWGEKDCGFHINVFKATDGELGSHCVNFSGTAVRENKIIGNIWEHPELLKK